MAVRRSTSLGMFSLPILIAIGIHTTVTPLKEMISIEPLIGVALYLFATIIGVILYMNTRKEKNSEFNRNKAMKTLRKTLEREDAGLWNENVNLESTVGGLNPDEAKGYIGDYNSESPEIEIGNDKKVDVDLLLESKHVVSASSRIRGESSIDSDSIDVTIGADVQTSFMDSVLDKIGGWFGRNSGAERAQKRQMALEAASKSAPITAQRPRAPMRSGSNASSTDDLIEEGLKSTGRPAPQQEIRFDKNGNEVPTQNHESLEAMAMVGSLKATVPIQNESTKFSSNSKMCNACGYSNALADSYCNNCGNSI